MSIFMKEGEQGSIETWILPSGDLSVSGPASGPLEQIMFEACARHGTRFNPGNNRKGWTIPSSPKTIVISVLERHLTKAFNP